MFGLGAFKIMLPKNRQNSDQKYHNKTPKMQVGLTAQNVCCNSITAHNLMLISANIFPLSISPPFLSRLRHLCQQQASSTTGVHALIDSITTKHGRRALRCLKRRASKLHFKCADIWRRRRRRGGIETSMTLTAHHHHHLNSTTLVASAVRTITRMCTHVPEHTLAACRLQRPS